MLITDERGETSGEEVQKKSFCAPNDEEPETGGGCFNAVHSMSDGCLPAPMEVPPECVSGDLQAEREKAAVVVEGGEEEEVAGTKCERESVSQHSEPKSRPRSDSSENNCSECAIPCCRKRKCVCKKECPPGTVRACMDPCCCNPCLPTPFVDNARLKEENKALKSCIKRVRQSAMTDACEIIKGVIGGCKCTCCKARTKLRPCKSLTTVPYRETWLCVPLPGSRCGGYTPSGWGKLLKKCRDELTCEPCGPCDVTGRATPCVNRRCKCLPPPRPCPPCPHLCPLRSLPAGMRPFTPCCPLYFPTPTCCPSSAYVPSGCGSAHTDKSTISYKSCASAAVACCSPCGGITAPPYRPMYTSLAAAGCCGGMPQPSASAPSSLPKVEALLKEEVVSPAARIYSPTYVSMSR